MHAIRLHEFGPAENLRYEEVPDPRPAAGEVRIAVEASGVHLLDTIIRAGASGGPFPLPELPAIPGREVAGTVDAVGPGVEEAWVGRRVAAHLGMASAGYAELAVAPVPALYEIPDDLEATIAVGAVGTGRTTMAILDVADLRTGDVVLVTAAAGGIGSLLVQAATAAGAELVVGAAGGPGKVDQVLWLGAGAAVDYDDPEWPEHVRAVLDGRAVTVAFDAVGGALGRGAFELLGTGGRLIQYGPASGEPTPIAPGEADARGVTVTSALGPRLIDPAVQRRYAELALAAAMAGALMPVVGPPFALADAAGAHRAMESRGTVGKTVLVP